MTKHDPQDGWWHERPTKAADLRTGYAQMYGKAKPRKRESVWPKAAMIVGLMFALTVALASMVAG